MENNQQNNILTREIRGLSLGVIITLISGAIAMILYMNKGYSNILEAINTSNTKNVVQDIRIEALENQNKEMKVRLDKMDIEITQLKAKQ